MAAGRQHRGLCSTAAPSRAPGRPGGAAAGRSKGRRPHTSRRSVPGQLLPRIPARLEQTWMVEGSAGPVPASRRCCEPHPNPRTAPTRLPGTRLSPALRLLTLFDVSAPDLHCPSQSKVGNKWSEVAKHIPGRTGQQCAQRWRHKVRSRALGAPREAVASSASTCSTPPVAHSVCSVLDRQQPQLSSAVLLAAPALP